MAQSGFRWIRPPSELGKEIERYGEQVIVAVLGVAEYTALKMQNEARVNARWTDRTGNARSGLFGAAVRKGAIITIILSHTVHYSIYLELANSQRYAIIVPTIEANLAELEQMLRQLLR
jgi:hypothetical protein